MLTIITGGAMSTKDRMLREKMLQSLKNGKKIYVFVPDQFSFEYDKMLYDRFGAKLFNKISTMGLNRFAEKLRKKYGSDKGATADDNAKIIAMYKAIKEFKMSGNSNFYTKNLEKPSFVTQMINISAQLSQNNISPEFLQSMSIKTEGVLSEKLREIGGIYGNYQKKLAENGLCDGFSLVNEACEILKKHDCFGDCEIYFDRYDTFSADEYRLIEIMLHQSENMYFAITLSDENNSNSPFSPFESTSKTCASLEKIAKSVGEPVNRLKSSQYHYNKSALSHINANVFCLEEHFSNDNEGVKVAFAQDVYDEVEFVAGEIKRLVREEKLKYSDIAVISRQLDDYAPIIEGTFEKYEIPTFIDAKQNISKSVLAIYITNILDCVRGKTFRTEKILRMIKSPLSPFKDFEVWAIEEYCYSWNVDGKMWLSPFTAVNQRNNNLDKVNEIRGKIIEPIVRFRKSCENSSANDIFKALTTLLEEYNLTSCANSVVKLSKNFQGEKSYITEKTTEVELVREFKQMWQLFIDAIYSLNDNFSDEKISLTETCNLFNLLMSQMTISNPPQRINTVSVAKAEHSRLSSVKAVFVLGANADKFPANIKSGGLFSEKEKRTLSEIGVDISLTALDEIKNERLTTYLALTQGTDKLYVCCPKNDGDGKPLVASSVVRELIKMFGNNIIIDVSKLGVDFFCKTKRSAISRFTEVVNDNTVESQSLKTALESVEDTSYKVKSVLENIKHEEFEISKKTAEDLFFNESQDKKQITLSPSSIEKYNKCPFSYFCDYGLKLKSPVKMDINAQNRGNIIHFVLENLLSEKIGDKVYYNAEFEKMTAEEIEEKVYELAKIYKELNLGGDFGKDARYDGIYERMCHNIVMVMLNIQQEILHSSFVPKAFEYSIKDENGETMLKLYDDEIEVCVTGQIDRIDTYTDKDGTTFLKIVDYKTGKVDNLLEKIFHGVSLQMVIYLMALLEGDNDINPNHDAQAGAMVYVPAKFIKSSKLENPSKFDEIKVDVKFTENHINETLIRKGIVNSDERVVFALNKQKDKNFCLSEKKEYFNVSEIDRIEEYAKERVVETGRKILRGKIDATPLVDITNGNPGVKPCSYCVYGDICGVKNAKPKRLLAKDDRNKLMDIVLDKNEETEGEENG